MADTSCEPMDVDLSANSVNAMEISHDDKDIDELDEPKLQATRDNDGMFVEPIPDVKPCISPEQLAARRKVPAAVSDNRSTANNNMSIIIVSLALIVLLISILASIQYECCQDFKLKELRDILSIKIHGQSHALSEMFTTIEADALTKLLIIYGGTGVGKTYAMSLMLENKLKYANVYHYTMSQALYPQTMFGLTLCQSSLIIVDDLNQNDMQIREFIKEMVMKSEQLGRNLTVILVYNCQNNEGHIFKNCDNTFQKQLEQHFEYINALKVIVKFRTLTEEHLKKCIENELGDRKITQEDMNKLMKNFNVTLDGCKGVYTKIKSMSMSKYS